MLLRNDRLRCWTREAVENRPAAWLHRFEPIPDNQIGDIDGDVWNVLDRYDHRTKLMHLTSGGPWFKGCEGHPCSDIWLRHKAEMEAARAAR